MPVRTFLSAAVLMPVCFGGWSGCQHREQRVPAHGATSFRFIEPPEPAAQSSVQTSASFVESRTIFQRAMPKEPLANPIYPPLALGGATNAWIMVAVHLTIGMDGSVTAVRPSLSAISAPSPFASEFRAAVDTAVKQWKFTPALVRYVEPVEDGKGGVYLRLARTEYVETECEVAFTFTSNGAVLPNASQL